MQSTYTNCIFLWVGAWKNVVLEPKSAKTPNLHSTGNDHILNLQSQTSAVRMLITLIFKVLLAWGDIGILYSVRKLALNGMCRLKNHFCHFLYCTLGFKLRPFLNLLTRIFTIKDQVFWFEIKFKIKVNTDQHTKLTIFLMMWYNLSHLMES